MAERTSTGRFQKGQSGNPGGRPPRARSGALQEPVTETVTRSDGYSNSITGFGTSRDPRLATSYSSGVLMPEMALDLWQTEFLAARIVEALPADAMKRGWTVEVDDKDADQGAIAELVAWGDDLELEERVLLAAQHERACGGSALVPVFSGAVGDLATPLEEGTVSRLEAVHLMEVRELQPATYYREFASTQFRRPETYYLTPYTWAGAAGAAGLRGFQRVHESRMVVFPGLRLTNEERNYGQRTGWGVSCLVRPQDVLRDFGVSWSAAAVLMQTMGEGVLEMDGYANLMRTASGEETVMRRVAAAAMARSALRVLIVDAKDKYTRNSGSLAGAAEMLVQFTQLLAAAAEMPATRLMGMSPAGLNATGESDTRNWYDSVEAYRRARLRRRLERVVRWMMRSTKGPFRGKEPKSWRVVFPSLWTPSEKEQAETRKVWIDAATALVNAQIVSTDDVAESLFPEGGKFSPDIRIDWKRRRAQAELDEQMEAQAALAEAQALEAESGEDDPELDALLAEVDSLLEDDDESSSDEGQEGDDEDDADQQETEGAEEAGEEEEEAEGDEAEGDEAEGEEEDEDDVDADPENGEEEEEEDANTDAEDRADRAPARSAKGQGYNPNRARDGKFAAGAKTKKPSKEERRIATIRKQETSLKKRATKLRQRATELRQQAKSGAPAGRAKAQSALEKARAGQASLKERAGALKAERQQLSAAVKAQKAEARAQRPQRATTARPERTGATTAATATTAAPPPTAPAPARSTPQRTRTAPAASDDPFAVAPPPRPRSTATAPPAAPAQPTTRRTTPAQAEQAATTPAAPARQPTRPTAAPAGAGRPVAAPAAAAERRRSGPTEEDRARQRRESAEADRIVKIREEMQNLKIDRSNYEEMIARRAQLARDLANREAGRGEISGDRHSRMMEDFRARIGGDESFAFVNYATTDLVWHLNSKLRGQRPPESVMAGRADEMMGYMDSGLRKAPPLTEAATVYRGVKPGTPFDRMKPGDSFTDPAYYSTSTRPDLAYLFTREKGSEGARGTLLRITMPAGTKAAAIPSSFAATEREILLPRGSKFRVDRVVEPTSPTMPRELFVTLEGD